MLVPSVCVADVAIKMTLGDHDSKGLARKERRRRESNDHTIDSVDI